MFKVLGGKVDRITLKQQGLKLLVLSLVIVFGGFSHTINQSKVKQTIAQRKIFQAVPVLLNNQLETVPFKELSNRKIASIHIGSAYAVAFDDMLRNYAPVSSFDLRHLNFKELSSYSTLILQIGPESIYSPATIDFLQQALKTKEVIIAGFGNIAALQRLDAYAVPILWSPEQTPLAAQRAAQIIFGGEGSQGKLAENISAAYPAGAGYSTWQTRLRYNVNAAELGIDSAKLNEIDAIVKDAISERATPGAVVMVVKQGNVIFNKAYGNHTYQDEKPTASTDIFDLASITKTAATTIAAMRLYEQNKLDLDASIGSYLADLQNSNKRNIPVREVMLHQAGFINLDFTSSVKAIDHSPDSSFYYPSKVADNYFMRRNYYQEKMWPKMLASPIPTRGQYVYSDISMYVMKEIIEHQAAMPLDQYVAKEFYGPLGMRTAGYNPRRRFDKSLIVPTENDVFFRKALLQGYVHDQGAALVDGVSGHAGLFASANDLAILNQMLLNGGTYGGVDYFKPETIDLFTKRESSVSYRGYGFDRANGHGYPSKFASTETYGHTGYTGTCVWVDPKYKLVYIFLSNRVNPSVSNKLNSLRVRPRIQDVVYAAIMDGERNLASVGD